MNSQDHIKFEIEGCVYNSSPETEQQVKKLMFAVHKPDSIVRCFDVETNLLLDELTLEDLFGN